MEQHFRPIHIGVYGHPNYRISKFKLDVLIEEKKNEIDYFNENVDYSENRHDDQETGERRDDEDETFWKKGNNSTVKMIFSILGSILEILLEVLI